MSERFPVSLIPMCPECCEPVEHCQCRPTMIPSEQETELRNHLDTGWDWLRELLDDPARRRVIERSAIARHRKGFETFGDTGWKKHPDELMVEMIEELADFLVYAAMRSYRRRGGPGV